MLGVTAANDILTLEVKSSGQMLWFLILTAAAIAIAAIIAFRVHAVRVSCNGADGCVVTRARPFRSERQAIARGELRGATVDTRGSGKREEARLVLDTKAGEVVALSRKRASGRDLERLRALAADISAFASGARPEAAGSFQLVPRIAWLVVLVPLGFGIALLFSTRSERTVFDRNAGTFCLFRGDKQLACHPLARVRSVETTGGRAPSIDAILDDGSRVLVARQGGSRFDPGGKKKEVVDRAAEELRAFLAHSSQRKDR